MASYQFWCIFVGKVQWIYLEVSAVQCMHYQQEVNRKHLRDVITYFLYLDQWTLY